MLGPHSSPNPAALKRAALTPIADRLGFDYDVSAVTAPASYESLALEAMRCCADLLIAFTYEDAWPREGLKQRRAAKRAARLIQDAVLQPRGRDAISWIAQRYGQGMADVHHRAANKDPARAEDLRATAEMDLWLSGVVAAEWPLQGHDAALAYAEECAGFSPVEDLDNPEAIVDLRGQACRTGATVEAICIASWPDAETLDPVFMQWWLGDLEHWAVLASDWTHVAPYWANLLREERRPWAEVADSIAAEHGITRLP